MNKKLWILAGLSLILAVAVSIAARKLSSTGNGNNLTVFAASSFAYVLHEQEKFIEERTGLEIVIVEAASSTLARQIARGAPADVFITADEVWLDYLTEKDRFEGEPKELARNRLVWVFTFSANQIEDMKESVETFSENNGKEDTLVIQLDSEEDRIFITGDPDYVPLGKYAKEALINEGRWETYQKELIPAENARQAAFLMETQAPAEGILYRTDALVSNNIIIIEEIPEESHTPILYFAAVLKQSSRGAAKNFLDFLKSEDFKTILQDKGFEVN